MPRLSELVQHFPKPDVTGKLVKSFKSAVASGQVEATLCKDTFTVPQEIKPRFGEPIQKNIKDYEYVENEGFSTWWQQALLFFGVSLDETAAVLSTNSGADPSKVLTGTGARLPGQKSQASAGQEKTVDPNKFAFKLEETAYLLGVSVDVVYRLVRSGELATFSLPGVKVQRVSRATLLEFIEACEKGQKAS